MALRAVCLSLAFSVSAGALSTSEMVHLFEEIGMKGLGFSLGVALLFLVTVIANALRYGDDVVRAASARGFDPAVQRRETSLFRRADGVFALGLLGLTGVLLLWPW